jgi:hypothetical protein
MTGEQHCYGGAGVAVGGHARDIARDIATLARLRWETAQKQQQPLLPQPQQQQQQQSEPVAAGAAAAAAAPSGLEKFVAHLCREGRTLVVFGGRAVVSAAGLQHTLTSRCWALDVVTSTWTEVLAAEAVGGGSRSESAAPWPEPRSFGADGGAGAVLTACDGHEWLAVHGGLRQEGYRDNETWLLGPLDAAVGAWQWIEVQPDGHPQSHSRPCPRFHHTFNVATGSWQSSYQQQLVILGGHNHRIEPILDPWLLSLGQLTSSVPQPPSDEAPPTTREPQEAAAAVCVQRRETVRWRYCREPRNHVEGPRARAHHATTVWRGGVIFAGGEAANGPMPNDVYWLDDVWLCDTTNELLGSGYGYDGFVDTTALCECRGNDGPQPLLSDTDDDDFADVDDPEQIASVRWVSLPSLPYAVSQAAMTILANDTLVLCGGGDGTGAVTAQAPGSTLLLNLGHGEDSGWDTWTMLAAPSLPANLFGATAVALHGGQTLLVLGGYAGQDTDGFQDPKISDLYDITQSWACRMSPYWDGDSFADGSYEQYLFCEESFEMPPPNISAERRIPHAEDLEMTACEGCGQVCRSVCVAAVVCSWVPRPNALEPPTGYGDDKDEARHSRAAAAIPATHERRQPVIMVLGHNLSNSPQPLGPLSCHVLNLL